MAVSIGNNVYQNLTLNNNGNYVIAFLGTSSSPTSASYGGQAMTHYGLFDVAPGYISIDVWYLANAPTGSHSYSDTDASTPNAMVSLIGADITVAPDAHTTGTGTSATTTAVSITTANDYDGVIGFIAGTAAWTFSAGANTQIVGQLSGNCLYASNPFNVSPAGTTTLNTTISSSETWGSVLLSIKSAVPDLMEYVMRESVPNPSQFTHKFKNTPKFGANLHQFYYTISASAGTGGTITPSGTTTYFDGTSATFSISANYGYDIQDVLVDGVSQGNISSYIFSNIQTNHTISVSFYAPSTLYTSFPASFTTSNYRWMTQSLLDSQQSYAVHPYTNIKIIDDDIVPMASNTVATPTSASYATAPTGEVLAFGLDSGDLKLFKSSDFSLGTWDSNVTIETANAKWNTGNTLQRYVLRVSDYINGTYHVDCWFLYNLDSSAGAYVQVRHHYSDDGGTTFTAETFTTTVLVSNAIYVGNPSLTAMTPRYNPKTQRTEYGFMYSEHITTGYYYNAAPNGYIYEIKYQWGDSTGLTETSWTQNINSFDWVIHSIDCQYFDGADRIVISGFRCVVDAPNFTVQAGSENYGIWMTTLFEPTASDLDVWDSPKEVFTTSSVSPLNVSQSIYPTLQVNGDLLDILFIGRLVDSIGTTSSTSTTLVGSTVTAQTMKSQTKNCRDFSYPTQLVYNNNRYTSYDNKWTYFINQSPYYYLTGGGFAWQYQGSTTVADVTNDVIQYSVQEAAGQPSSVTLQIANQNNMWYPSGTNPGASAIAGNKKIVIQQGYHTSNGVETVPRDVFYIDNINQNSSYNTNDITISGRNFYKKLMTTVSKYAKNWYGPFSYVDVFDNTLSNWNQQSGSWEQSNNTLTMASAPSSDAVITLSNNPPLTRESIMVVWMKGVTAPASDGQYSGYNYIYPAYIDSNNYVQLEWRLYNNAGTINLWWAVVVVAGGAIKFNSSAIDAYPNLPDDTSKYYPFIIRQYDYLKFTMFYGSDGAGSYLNNVGNQIYGIDASYVSQFNTGVYSTNVLDLSLDSNQSTATTPLIVELQNAASSMNWSVGLGANGLVPSFKYFSYHQYGESLNLEEAIKHAATQAGIFDYTIQKDIDDKLFGQSHNRTLYIDAAATHMYGTSLDNGEFSFVGKCVDTPGYTNTNGIRFIFRADSLTNPQNYYTFDIQTYPTAQTNFVAATLGRTVSGTHYRFDTTPFGVGDFYGNLNFDLHEEHTYRIVFINATMYAYVDDIMVCAWTDNNSTESQTYLTSGYLGWEAFNTSDIVISNLSATAFWKQNPSLSINPGDDILSTLTHVTQSVRSWFFGDILGRFKALFLSSSDPSTYTYHDQIYMQGVTKSDKEYVSQVTVYGNNVQATARDNNLLQNAPVREEVIVDYSITTEQDAQTRANQELTNANQYQSQYNPKQTMNVGAELFDVVDVVDTGNNTSGTDSTSRVYAEKFSTGGKNNQNEYSIEIDTGNV